jgi:hypothetical protein
MTRKPLFALGLIGAGALVALGVAGAVVAAGAIALGGAGDGHPAGSRAVEASPSPSPRGRTPVPSPEAGEAMRDAMNDAMVDVETADGQPPKPPAPPAKPTAEERACMADLTARVKEATLRLQDPEVAKAEGYRFPDDPAKTHMPNPAYKRDGQTLDEARPETAMYRLRDDGAYQLVGVMFVALKGQGPRPCGNATRWHTHMACVDEATRKPLDLPAGAACPPGSTMREGRAEMMHVWFVPRKQR